MQNNVNLINLLVLRNKRLHYYKVLIVIKCHRLSFAPQNFGVQQKSHLKFLT